MTIELFYVSIALMAGYQGATVLHRGGPAQRLYGWMLLLDAALGAIAYSMSGRDGMERTTGLLGAIAIGGGVSLLILPLILRDLSRRFAAREWVRLAIKLAELRELLSPGLGGRQEADVLRVVADVRAGRIDGALALLQAERSRARSPIAQRALKDRILTTLLYVNRWREAVEAYEAEPPSATGAAVAAELVRAYGEIGKMDGAAALVERLERSPESHDPLHQLILARARLLFLAFTGRVIGVAALVSPRGPLSVLPDAARSYWLGTARLFAGDRAGAREVLADAERAAGRESRWGQLVRDRIASADTAEIEIPPTLSPEVAALADQLALLVDQAPPVAAPPEPKSDRPVTVYVLMAVNLAVFGLATWLAGGDTAHSRTLARLGANLPAAVLAGEWWRLPASTVLHLGFAHLAVNMVSLWSMGRPLEPHFGRYRFLAVYLLAGIGGAVASTLFGKGGMSVGASGAVFGVVGAFFAEILLLRRQPKRPSPWRKDTLGALLFIIVANLGIGFLSPMIDQAAHVGGLVSGALVAALISTNGPIGARPMARWLTAGLLAVSLAAFGYAIVGVATTTRLETIDRVGWERRTVRGVAMELPKLWRWPGDDRIIDPTWELQPTLTVALEPAREAAGAFDAVRAELASEPKITDVAVDKPSFAPPSGWTSQEIRFRFGAVEGTPGAVFRELVFLRTDHDRALIIGIVVPEDALGEAAPIVTRILGSI